MWINFLFLALAFQAEYDPSLELSPEFNIPEQCNVVARHYGHFNQQLFDDCVVGETENREVLRTVWMDIPDQMKDECVGFFSDIGLRPNYLYVLSCIEDELSAPANEVEN